MTYDLPPDLLGKAWGGRYRGQKQKWFAFRFLGPDSEISIVPPPGHKAEFVAWKWAPVDDLLGLIVPFKRAVYQDVLAEFAALARPPRSNPAQSSNTVTAQCHQLRDVRHGTQVRDI